MIVCMCVCLKDGMEEESHSDVNDAEIEDAALK